jgi:hypothetical protein
MTRYNWVLGEKIGRPCDVGPGPKRLMGVEGSSSKYPSADRPKKAGPIQEPDSNCAKAMDQVLPKLADHPTKRMLLETMVDMPDGAAVAVGFIAMSRPGA